MKRGTLAVAVAATLAITIGVGVLARRSTGSEEPTTVVGRWRVYTDAFGAPSTATDAASLLMPANDGCFHAVGVIDADPHRFTGKWTATGDCSVIRTVGPTSLPPVRAGVVSRTTPVDTVRSGGYQLTLVAYLYNGRARGEAFQGTPDHWTGRDLVHPPDGEDRVPAAVSALGTTFLAVGRHGERPVAWPSLDAGATWVERPLPVPSTGGAVEPLSVAAHPDSGTAVVVGRATGSTRPIVWRTTDAAGTWHLVDVPEAAVLTDVVYDGTAFVAVGSRTADGAALVLTSVDGLTWRADPAALPATARDLRTVYALRPASRADDGIVVGAPPPPPPTVYAIAAGGACASLLRRAERGWLEESLGCYGVPTSLIQLADGRLAAAGGTTLWLSQT